MKILSLGEKIEIFASLFGCWHTRVTRPLMDGKTAYQACVKCGARRLYNPETFRSYGKFYYPLVSQNKEQ